MDQSGETILRLRAEKRAVEEKLYRFTKALEKIKEVYANHGHTNEIGYSIAKEELEAERGLYEKYKVERTDGGSAPGKKHDGCPYFVLDLEHDKHAKVAILAYAASCAGEYPVLSNDLFALTRSGCNCQCVTLFSDGPRKPNFGAGY